MYYQRNTGARSRNHCCSGKVISITFSKGVFVALVIPHATSMRRNILSSVVCLAVLYFFSHNLTNGTNFGKKKK